MAARSHGGAHHGRGKQGSPKSAPAGRALLVPPPFSAAPRVAREGEEPGTAPARAALPSGSGMRCQGLSGSQQRGLNLLAWRWRDLGEREGERGLHASSSCWGLEHGSQIKLHAGVALSQPRRKDAASDRPGCDG